MQVRSVSVVTQAEITGTAVTQFFNELEDQSLPFNWWCVSTRTLKLFLDGEETPCLHPVKRRWVVDFERYCGGMRC